MNKHAFIVVASIFTVFIVFGVIHNTTNKRHSVEFFSGSNFSGYEQTVPAAQIDASPAIAWDHTSGFLKALGWVFLGLLWVGCWYVGTDRHLGKVNSGGGEKKGLAYLFTAGPLILSVVFFFAAYSSGQANNSISVERSRFDGWVQTGAIKQRGEKTYVDGKGSDTLTNLFKGKDWIK